MYLFYVCQSFLFYIINFSSHIQNIYTINIKQMQILQNIKTEEKIKKMESKQYQN